MWYRGYFELQITQESVRALFFGLPTILNRNPHEISLANFTVLKNENRLQRPVGGGEVESGSLKEGKVALKFLANNTETGEWFVTGEGRGWEGGKEKQVSVCKVYFPFPLWMMRGVCEFWLMIVPAVKGWLEGIVW